MNEHRTASFVAGMAWAAFVIMCGALFFGYAPTSSKSAFGMTAVGLLAFVASCICAVDGRRGPTA